MKVTFAKAAEDDLQAIADFIATDSPQRAETFVNELLDRCLQLGETPEAFQRVPRYEQHGIRRRIYRGYLIFYRLTSAGIEVLHVLHGARDYEALLFPDE